MEIGDQIQLGNYPQAENGDEKPIRWRVVAKSGDNVLIVALRALECEPFHKEFESCTWESSHLREWLNKNFYLSAFTSDEQDRILYTFVPADKNPKFDTDQGVDTEDFVFLLSAEEAGLYFQDDKDRVCMPTPYAAASGVWKWNDSDACNYLLRSSGGNQHGVAYIDSTGKIRFRGASVCEVSNGVRPAMVIKQNQ